MLNIITVSKINIQTYCTSVQVDAGSHVELKVQLFALSAVEAGVEEPQKYISHDVIIHTEMDILFLPVTANILQTPGL